MAEHPAAIDVFVSASLQALITRVLPGIRDAEKVFLVDHRLSSLNWEDDIDVVSKVRYSTLKVNYPAEHIIGLKSHSLAAALSAAKTPDDQAFIKLMKATIIFLLEQTEYTFSEEPLTCPIGIIVNNVWCFVKKPK